MNLYTKTKVISIIAAAAILTGCGGGGGGETATGTPTAQVSKPVAKAVQEGQVKDSATGQGLADVEVSIGGATVTTDDQGFYKLTDVAVSDETTVTFKQEGYYENSEIIAIKSGTPNFLECRLDKYDDQHSDSADNEKLWSFYFGIEVPGGIYTDSQGNNPDGNAVASVAYENVSTEKGRDLFPGAFEGRDRNGVIVPFVSYGFMVVDLEDENGNALSTTGDMTLTFHSAEGATAESIPLWYYDYDQGVWIEEGYATRLGDGKYEGAISHPGTWSLSQPVEKALGTYIDRITYEDGTPAANLRVRVEGKNWVRTDLTTDANGVLEIEVIPGEAFSLEVYNYEDRYGAEFDGMMPAVASGETSDNIEQ